jgi:exopolyphosphatase/guanosine-5'-triphosphate,3'-diphosphate pyrophosphatase
MGLDGTTNIAAIDAGSNAIRLVIARAESPSVFHEIKNERAALRLGHPVFSSRDLDSHSIDQAVQVFRRFKTRMNQYDVQRYRAVATSAAREARNRGVLVEKIFRASGIRLEIIDAAEEAALVRTAVEGALGGRCSPRLVVDVGGGSLQVTRLKDGALEQSVTLPLGTVRLMESFGINGRMSAHQVRLVREWSESMLRRYWSAHPAGPESPAVWCGGNAEALALIAPGARRYGVPTVDLRVLRRKLGSITRRDIRERMETFLVRKDRAEVMAIAAIVLLALGRWWNVERALVPGVGVKEGVLRDVLRSLYPRTAELQPERAVASARQVAARLHYDEKHCEQVRMLALSLFDQTQGLHGMGQQMRLILELGALLHDVGHVVRREGHHKHGEYLVRNADLTGLNDRQQDLLACVVRYHSQSEPNPEHKVYASLRSVQQREIRELVSLLRLADRLDCDHRQSVSAVRVRPTAQGLVLQIKMRRASDLIFWAVRRGAGLFEKEFGMPVLLERKV